MGGGKSTRTTSEDVDTLDPRTPVTAALMHKTCALKDRGLDPSQQDFLLCPSVSQIESFQHAQVDVQFNLPFRSGGQTRGSDAPVSLDLTGLKSYETRALSRLFF